jgi:ABC-2 type transport system ATP-binding protein
MRYGDREVLHGIDLVVPHGMVVGFLGPNGAGKTTTVEILEGYRRRSAGHSSVLGMDPASGGRELRERIGIVLQETGHNPDLTVRETVRQFASYYRRPLVVDEVVELVGLEEAADRRVRALRAGSAGGWTWAGPGRRPRAGLPGRADHRLRPGRPPPGLGGDRRLASWARRSC